MKTLILTLVCLLLVIPCQAQEKQLKQSRQIQEQLNKIENCFIGKIAELQLRAAAEVGLLEVAEKPMPAWAGITEWADFAETVLKINVCEDEPYSHKPYSFSETKTLTPVKRLAVALSRIAKRKNDILGRSEMVALNLERQKEYALTVRLAELERPKEKAITPETKATHGLVGGIVYSSDKASAIVDHKIVHEGDTIHGVAVVKIYKDKVVFEKNGDKWEQAVGQTPEAYWK
jgi:hypothetical protein